MKLVAFFAFMLLHLIVNAQKLTVESIKQLDGDLSARTEQRIDLNGMPCALLKVWVIDNLVDVQGNTIGQFSQNVGGEKNIYLSGGSREVRMFFENHLPFTVTFIEYGIKNLESNSTYLLVLTEDNDSKYQHDSFPHDSHGPTSAMIDDEVEPFPDNITIAELKSLADNGNPKAYAVLAEKYFIASNYYGADVYSRKALTANIGKKLAIDIIEKLDIIGFYDNGQNGGKPKY